MYTNPVQSASVGALVRLCLYFHLDWHHYAQKACQQPNKKHTPERLRQSGHFGLEDLLDADYDTCFER